MGSADSYGKWTYLCTEQMARESTFPRHAPLHSRTFLEIRKRARWTFLDDVISDGQPGDLLVCGGSGVGFVDRPNLVACVQGGGGFEMRLPRQGTAKSTFVTRWPAD